MMKRIFFMILFSILVFKLCGCEYKKALETETAFENNPEIETSEVEGVESSETAEPLSGEIKSVEKIDIVWLKSDLIPVESIQIQLDYGLEKLKELTYEVGEVDGSPILVSDYETGKYGLIDTSGKKIFSDEYSMIDYTDDEMMSAGEYDGDSDLLMKFGYIDHDGNKVIAFDYDDVSNFKGDFAKVGQKDEAGIMKYGYINKNGEQIVPFEYDDGGNFADGLAKVGKRKNDGEIKYGYIDERGEIVVPLKYTAGNDFSNGLASVAKDEEEIVEGKKYQIRKWGFIDKMGKEVIPFKFTSVGCGFTDGITKVSIGSCEGYIDTTGKEILPVEYANAYYVVSTGLFWVCTFDYEEGYLDKNGKTVLPFLSHGKHYGIIKEGFVAKTKIKKGDTRNQWKTGFLNQRGEMIIPMKYYLHSKVDGFSDGLVKLGKEIDGEIKYGFFDTNGTKVIPIKYDKANNFEKGLTVVGNKNKYGIIDRNGKLLTKIEYDEICTLNKGRYGFVRKGNEYGVYKNPYCD